MGIQINFYLTPADQKELAGRIARVEPMTLLAARSTATSAVGQAPVEASERIVYMARTADLELVHYDYVEEQGYWYIDDGASPVIQFIRCSLDESTLRRGRLCCEHHRLDAHGAWQQKPETFVSWSRRVLAAARRTLRHDKSLLAYLGPEAALRRAESRVTFST